QSRLAAQVGGELEDLTGGTRGIGQPRGGDPYLHPQAGVPGLVAAEAEDGPHQPHRGLGMAARPLRDVAGPVGGDAIRPRRGTARDLAAERLATSFGGAPRPPPLAAQVGATCGAILA